MARGRILSRTIAHDAKFNRLSVAEQWFFMRILPFADDHGRINADLEELHLEALPYYRDFKVEVTRKNLNKLEEAGIVEWQENVVIQLTNFKKHQKIGHRPAESKFPNVSGEYDKLNKTSESLDNISQVKSNKSESIDSVKNKLNGSKYESRPKDVEMVIDYLKELGKADPEKYGHQIYNHYDARNWYSGKTKIKKWKSCIKTWNLEKATTPIKTLTELVEERNRAK